MREINARCRRNNEQVSLTISKALQAIDEINEAAVRRQGIILEKWSPERVARIEDSLLGVLVDDREVPAALSEPTLAQVGYGIALKTAGDAAQSDGLEPAHSASETTFVETTPESFSASEAVNPRPSRRRSKKASDAKEGDAGFTFED